MTARSLLLRGGCALLATLIVTSIAPSAENYGRFEGTVRTEWLPENRAMKLLEKFAFVDPANKRWEVPVGAVVDGASIPRVFWSIVGEPFDNPYRNASVIHDYYCNAQTEDWWDTHRMFYYGMLAAGTGSKKAKLMYYAVYVGGPRWKVVRFANHPPRFVPKPGDKDELKLVPWTVSFDSKVTDKDLEWISATDPSLDQIDARAELAFDGKEPPDYVRTDLETKQ